MERTKAGNMLALWVLCLAGSAAAEAPKVAPDAPIAPAPAAAAAPAVEASDSEKATRYFDSGMKHYNLAEYPEALADFKAAYRLVPDPAFLFNIGQAHRQLGEAEDAAQAYRAYLRVNPDITPEKKAAVEKFIADADAAVAARAAQQPPTGLDRPAANEDGARAAEGGVFPGLLGLEQGAPAARRGTPIYKKWWFWTAVGVVVLGGVAAGVAIPLAGRPEGAIDGSLMPGAIDVQ